ncbi:spinster family MFS transporter [Phenylobacterium sp.]|uniref:spinster family MFS transporter n=1 Tax=Phenylobacterium sp. TaxID=1871053 RepID=UPI002FE0F71B
MSTLDTSAAPAPATAAMTKSTRYVLVLLFLFYLFNFLDRQIVNILAEPIKTDLGLADWQLGAMTGLAFALFYTVLGIPLARYADRPTTDRPKLMAVCVIIWSGMTALCGLAANFVQLLLFRIGVGIGEAGCSPAAHSLISDLVPRERRARAMSLYSLGIPLGKLIGMVIGGVVAHAWGWRAAFVLVGAPGVILGVVAWFTLRDPRRDAPKPAQVVQPLPLMRVVRDLLPNGALWWVSLAGAFMSFLSYGQSAFVGSFFIRVHGLNVGQAGVLLGLAFGLAGAVGTWAGGQITDRVAARRPRAYVLLPALAAAGGAALFALAVMAPTMIMALLLLAAASALNSSWYGPVFAAVQSIVRPQQKATAAAVHLFVVALIGLGLGPLIFGAVSDWLNGRGLGVAEGLRYALLLASIPAALLAIFCFWMASLSITRHLADGDAHA